VLFVAEVQRAVDFYVAKFSFEGWPPPSEYGRLMQEYAREGARPR